MLPTGKKLLFTAVTLLGFLSLAEAGAHLAPESALRTREQLILDHARSAGFLSPNLDVPGWDVVEDGVQNDLPYHLDAWHMRGPDYPQEKPANAVRVIFVGDSSVFGVQLKWEESFTAHFEHLREQRLEGVDYQVANCASPGHSSYQSRIKLERHCLDFQPDLVVIGNQFSDSTLEQGEDKDRFPKVEHPDLIRAAEKLALVRLGNQLWWERVGSKSGNPEVIVQHGTKQNGKTARVNLDDYEENLGAMVDMVRAAGSEPVLMVLAALGDTVFQQDANRVVSLDYRERMARVAAAKEVQLVDLSEVVRSQFAGQESVFLDPVHPSALGALIYAKALDAQLPEPAP